MIIVDENQRFPLYQPLDDTRSLLDELRHWKQILHDFLRECKINAVYELNRERILSLRRILKEEG